MLGRGKTLAQMAAEVFANNVDKGWRGPDAPVKSFGDRISLLHSELSEALEAMRDYHDVRPRYQHFGPECYYAGDVTEEPECHITEGHDCTCNPKPVGVDSEFADVLIRLLDEADALHIDLDRAYEEKMAFNRTRSFRHGGKSL